MTVREMIECLGRFPSEMRVVVNGYEDGYDDLSRDQISVVRIALDTGVHSWEGRHLHSKEVTADAAESVTTEDALVLHRTSN